MARTQAGPNTLTELASRIRGIAHDEAVNNGTHFSRWTVRQPSPLIIEELEGDLVLEEGDPDFTIGDLLRKFRATNALVAGDQLLVIHASGEWHAVDVVTSRTSWEP
jgi:hypothetical protein